MDDLICLSIMYSAFMIYGIQYLVRNRLFTIPPDKALITYGPIAARKRAQCKPFDYSIKTRGSALVLPKLQHFQWIDRGSLMLDINVYDVPTRDEKAVHMESVAVVRIGRSRSDMETAISLLFESGDDRNSRDGRNSSDGRMISFAAQKLIERHLRETCAKYSAQDIFGKRIEIARAAMQSVKNELADLGMEVLIVRIRDVDIFAHARKCYLCDGENTCPECGNGLDANGIGISSGPEVSFMNDPQILMAVAAACAALLLIVVVVFRKRTVIVTPGQALFIYGSFLGSDAKETGIRLATDGKCFIFPFVQNYRTIPTEDRILRMNVYDVVSRDAGYVDICMEAVFRIAVTPDSLKSFAEQHVSRDIKEIEYFAQKLLEGHVREAGAAHTHAEFFDPSPVFKQHLVREIHTAAESDLLALALILESVEIREIPKNTKGCGTCGRLLSSSSTE